MSKTRLREVPTAEVPGIRSTRIPGAIKRGAGFPNPRAKTPLAVSRAAEKAWSSGKRNMPDRPTNFEVSIKNIGSSKSLEQQIAGIPRANKDYFQRLASTRTTRKPVQRSL